MKNNFRRLRPGVSCFYIHFLTEVLCYYVLGRYMTDSVSLWLVPLVYDLLAFVPQSLIGALSDRFKKLPLGTIGFVLMSFAVGLYPLVRNAYIVLLPLCLGNGFVHVAGAEVTLRCADGRLAPSAIYVAGGSFGVITGKLLSMSALPNWIILLYAFTALPFLVQTHRDRLQADAASELPCGAFCYANPNRTHAGVILLAVWIVAVRGYMGYGIPTSWNTTTGQTVALYLTMGAGKALGGILADRFGVRRTAVCSTAAALPFLLLGDRIMLISLAGVMLFSMTMSVTLAALVSVLPNNPGAAFGLTTIGLFLGTLPIFFFKFSALQANCVLLTVLTAVSLPAMFALLGKDRKHV